MPYLPPPFMQAPKPPEPPSFLQQLLMSLFQSALLGGVQNMFGQQQGGTSVPKPTIASLPPIQAAHQTRDPRQILQMFTLPRR